MPFLSGNIINLYLKKWTAFPSIYEQNKIIRTSSQFVAINAILATVQRIQKYIQWCTVDLSYILNKKKEKPAPYCRMDLITFWNFILWKKKNNQSGLIAKILSVVVNNTFSSLGKQVFERRSVYIAYSNCSLLRFHILYIHGRRWPYSCKFSNEHSKILST